MTRIVLTALVLLDCVAFGTELFAQAGQTINPVPITPPTLNTATTTCQTNCDTQAMFCQNSCVLASPAASLQGGVDAPRDQSALDPRIRIPNAEISQGADRDRARPMTSS
jgi:hypothetical protein